MAGVFVVEYAPYLKADTVSLTIIEPLSVVEIEELEDEGPSYIIKASNNETVLLTGQEIRPYKRKKFPWSKFGVLEAPKSSHFFGLKCMGESIPVDKVIPSLTYDKAKKLGCFNKNFIILDKPMRKVLNEA